MNLHRAHRWPQLVRVVAAVIFLSTVVAIFISYRNRSTTNPRAGDAFPKLSKRLVSVAENVEHRRERGAETTLFLKAARDEVYDDGHHELTDVVAELYDETGKPRGSLRAGFCIYDPTQTLVIFQNRVSVTAWDMLSLETERLTYEQKTGLILSDQPVQFRYPHWRGQVVGIEVRTQPGQEQIIFKQHVRVEIDSSTGSTNQIIRLQSDSAYATKADASVHLLGNVSLTQSTQSLRADRMVAVFNHERQLQHVEAQGRCVMTFQSESRISEVRASSMKFLFDAQQRLHQATATGGAVATVTDAREVRQVRAFHIEATFVPSSGGAVHVARVVGDRGRVDVQVTPVKGAPSEPRQERARLSLSSSEQKRLVADRIELLYQPGGRELDRATASGQVELVLEPLAASRAAERKTIRAGRMEIAFYQDGNLAETLNAQDVQVEFEPLKPTSARAKRTTKSKQLVGQIDRATQDLTSLTQSGDFHFVEGDRQAKADTATYDAATHIISLRGGEPVIWDSRARTRAEHIQIDVQAGTSVAQGRVTTTYYNQEATERATPFQQQQSPVFIAADRVEVNHENHFAVYTGKARAWQEEAYVTAQRLELYGRERMMVAVGQVKSGFYRAPAGHQTGQARSFVPVFVSAGRMTYQDSNRLVRYESQVQLQHADRRMMADQLSVFLKPELNEIERVVADGHVVVTEPQRQAFGDQAVYTAADERVVIIGRPARIEDDRYEAAQRGSRLTYLMGDDKVVLGDHEGSQRVKSMRKIQ
ncbi:MAG: LptA/OstA family protein [Acidobacteriota bacterium]|nr:LPS export ABC transporter periplasmic protein LptC [Blastocatellia bacterium]MDW8238506.1 LptA/OstA family protein [Acidobacteriota bacterium]